MRQRPWERIEDDEQARARRERLDRIRAVPLIRNPVLRGLARAVWFTALALTVSGAAFLSAHFVRLTPVAVLGMRRPTTIGEVGWIAWVLAVAGAALVGVLASVYRGFPWTSAWGPPWFLLLFCAFSVLWQGRPSIPGRSWPSPPR